jgi:hypothetical protein
MEERLQQERWGISKMVERRFQGGKMTHEIYRI